MSTIASRISLCDLAIVQGILQEKWGSFRTPEDIIPRSELAVIDDALDIDPYTELPMLSIKALSTGFEEFGEVRFFSYLKLCQEIGWRRESTRLATEVFSSQIISKKMLQCVATCEFGVGTQREVVNSIFCELQAAGLERDVEFGILRAESPDTCLINHSFVVFGKGIKQEFDLFEKQGVTDLFYIFKRVVKAWIVDRVLLKIVVRANEIEHHPKFTEYLKLHRITKVTPILYQKPTFAKIVKTQAGLICHYAEAFFEDVKTRRWTPNSYLAVSMLVNVIVRNEPRACAAKLNEVTFETNWVAKAAKVYLKTGKGQAESIFAYLTNYRINASLVLSGSSDSALITVNNPDFNELTSLPLYNEYWIEVCREVSNCFKNIETSAKSQFNQATLFVLVAGYIKSRSKIALF